MAIKLAEAYVELQARGVQQTTAQVAGAATQFTNMGEAAQSAGVKVAQTGQRSGNVGMAIYQLGQAAEDAAIGFSINGLSGALIGAGNNLAFVASMVNPVVGGIVGLGVAAAATALRLSGMKTATQQANAALEQADALQKALGLQIERQQRALTFDEQIGEADSVEEMSNLIDEFKENLNQLGVAQDILGPKLQQTAQDLVQWKAKLDALTFRRDNAINLDEHVDLVQIARDIDGAEQAIANLEAILSTVQPQFRENATAAQQLLFAIQDAESAMRGLSLQASIAGQLTDIGGLFTNLADTGKPILLDLKEADNQFRDWMEENNRQFQLQVEAQAAKDEAIRLRRKAELMGNRDEEDQARRRQAEFGGIGDLARRLQERANNRQEQLLGQVATNTRQSQDTLDRIAESVRGGAIAG